MGTNEEFLYCSHNIVESFRRRNKWKISCYGLISLFHRLRGWLLWKVEEVGGGGEGVKYHQLTMGAAHGSYWFPYQSCVHCCCKPQVHSCCDVTNASFEWTQHTLKPSQSNPLIWAFNRLYVVRSWTIEFRSLAFTFINKLFWNSWMTQPLSPFFVGYDTK